MASSKSKDKEDSDLEMLARGAANIPVRSRGNSGAVNGSSIAPIGVREAPEKRIRSANAPADDLADTLTDVSPDLEAAAQESSQPFASNSVTLTREEEEELYALEEKIGQATVKLNINNNNSSNGITRQEEVELHELEEKIGHTNGNLNRNSNSPTGGHAAASLPGAYACAPTPSASAPGGTPMTSASDDEIGEMTMTIGFTSTAHSSSAADLSGLVEALPVEHVDETTLPRAELEEDHFYRHSEAPKVSNANTQRCVGAGILCLFLVAVVTVAIVLSSTNTADKKQSNESEQGKGPLFFEEHLPGYTLEAIRSDYNSPQAKAHRWLVADPHLSSYTNQAQLLQRFVLATFFFATNGNTIGVDTENDSDESSTINMTGTWKSQIHYLLYEKHECDWGFLDGSYSAIAQGIIKAGYPCAQQPMSAWEFIPYTKLWMAQNALVGTLPEELYLLTSLESIDLSLQHSPLTLEQSWTLSYNHDLAKPIFGGPSTIHLSNESIVEDSLTLSQQMQFESCLGGTISSRIRQLNNLQELKIAGNCFQGTLPSELGLLHQNMKLEFRILGNFFSGTLPTELFALSSLRFLSLSFNDFSGTIPSEIGQVTSLGLFGASGNSRLSGSIPSELGGLASLYYLAISNNRHTGKIPSELGQLQYLHGLTIEENQITGEIPSELGRLKILGVMNLSSNRLSGNLPSELSCMSNGLYSLHLQNNLLSSSIPSEYGSLSRLHELFLEDNLLQFQLPSEIGQLSRLHRFTIQNNRISGSIPSELGLWGANATEIEYDELIDLIFEINLSGNLLDGNIPTELEMLTMWRDLDLANNNLSGIVPESLCRQVDNTAALETSSESSGVQLFVHFDCDPKRLCGCDCLCDEEELP